MQKIRSCSNHTVKDCRSDKSKLNCTECKKSGHVAKVCIGTLLGGKSKSTQKATNSVQEETINSVQRETALKENGVFQIIDIYQNRPLDKDRERFYAQVNVEGKLIQFEIDSGSGYTFLPRNQYAKLQFNGPLEPATIRFRSYTRDVFVPDGKITVNAELNGNTIKDDIYIVPKDYDAILGRVWIRKLYINLLHIDQQNQRPSMESNAVSNINEVDEIITQYADIFEEKIGCVPNYKVNLKLREKAKPIFHREREIPYALFSRVEKELDSLEEAGIMTKTDTSDWGSPLVVIPKADGGVRLCVDYKVGINERLMDAHYPIRKTNLHNSRYFCRLDLYKAYLHLQVDDQSSEIQTISTHRGTYKMNRLSFGIKTAPSEFNRIIDQVLRDVQKTEKYFDDIVVHGSTKEECEENLVKCLDQLRKFDLHLNRRKCNAIKLATRVFSKSFSDAIKLAISTGRVTCATPKATALFLLKINNIFDTNSKTINGSNDCKYALSDRHPLVAETT
ncbi:Reverse transcriptase (RNA-dependent DNA polymerase) [Popillia japonica]|uniref:Reverse transcriptase (RNA-dependent DNA polymerase) n=1 Tax=Popillia japonica TaxID=7064 RepID=A0AAW1N273_POPJA